MLLALVPNNYCVGQIETDGNDLHMLISISSRKKSQCYNNQLNAIMLLDSQLAS